ncbi:uncharacterized protein C16orf52 homolog A-like [Haliotis cracherodii]|uniref:uncharacterized protein C16orf52 homolog A-like n=1 Tax=Haliotis rufescens TaxID=6454 RepID=UPI001EB0570F|nr:uncharacterized protein C16orf52 homolog A-like [Haliotis rufescens]
MDKLTALSGILFFTADVFAIGSLANPDWIVTSVAGNMRLGLTRQCQMIHGRPEICTSPRLSTEWMFSFICIVGGILCLTATCALLFASHWRRATVRYSRWLAFIGMTLFCLAAIVFPVGFHIDEIGGQPYKLPNHTQVGSSYVLFIMAIFFTIISELFTGKVCLPVL